MQQLYIDDTRFAPVSDMLCDAPASASSALPQVWPGKGAARVVQVGLPMAPSSYKSWNLTKTDTATITARLAAMAKTLAEDGMGDAEILISVAAEKIKLEAECKQQKQQQSINRAQASKREIEPDVAPTDSRKPAAFRMLDTRPGDQDSSNLDYFAQVETARQLVINHPIFDKVIDELPLVITGSQLHLSGVQACCNILC